MKKMKHRVAQEFADPTITEEFDTLDRWRTFAAEAVEAMKGFEVPRFSADSMEVRRDDHDARVSALKLAAERVSNQATKALTSEINQHVVDEWSDAVRDFVSASEAVFCAETWAWIALRMKLEDILKDPRIEFNPEVVRFVGSMLDLVKSASGHSDYRTVLLPLETQFKREQASRSASSKNAAEREWVRREWRNRSDKGQSKASFARQHAQLVKAKFGTDVTSEQIAREWLPKGRVNA
ncbi:hypothetical protein ACFQNJ_03575 [Hydrogenophaga bisanensis]|uniref:Uncharacterized protein n=1 Tax=Hydrogenophaga bisanensis TaxID=439611 RepID=A0ABW2R551_9BURK